MEPIDELKIELDEERKSADKRYAKQERAARDEEILNLTRIEFRQLLENELEIHLLPYLQINSKSVRFVQDSIKEPLKNCGRVITGYLANGRSRLTFKLNPGYDGHNRSVYDSIDFYPKKNEPLTDAIVLGMRETRDKILDYFKYANIIGRKPLKSKI